MAYTIISRRFLTLSFSLAVATLIGCGGNTKDAGKALEGAAPLDDLNIVDCLLPGQLRQLGNSSYLTPRRPINTTAADCRIRGGEYVAYDRADYKTALAVWMPSAEAGDAEAQANVGEIFERGLGGEPNYEAAAIWYERAAQQGNSRAQFNLGTLYEQGNGVEKNKMIALNWYRQAWGLPEDNVIYKSAADKAATEQQNALRAELETKMKQRESQIALLNKQLTDLRNKPVAVAKAPEAKQEQKQLEEWVQKLEAEKLLAMNEIDSLPRYRQPTAAPTIRVKSDKQQQALELDNMNFGRYHALIIGNQNYDTIDDLRTPHPDALRAKKLLEENYGFDVTVLLDADNASLMRAINDLNDKLTEEDNLLIFYAGHGSRIESNDYTAGYWLPVNANQPPNDTFWVSNEFVTRHLDRIKAKRIMVVADSCYSGLLSTAPGYLLMGEDADYSNDYIRYKLPKRSRLLLSSGGDKPVLDNKGDGNSIFARAFLDTLEESKGIITGPELFQQVRERVSREATEVGFDQKPEFKAIKGAGHEVGDFFFVRKS